jgi:hypothetical protein
LRIRFARGKRDFLEFFLIAGRELSTFYPDIYTDIFELSTFYTDIYPDIYPDITAFTLKP